MELTGGVEAEGRLLWEPSAQWRARASLTAFMGWVNEREGTRFAEYGELWQWSVDELERFWAAIWEYCGVRSSRPYERVLVDRAMPGARWFPGSELNYAENMLAGREERAVAVLHASELRPLRELTWGQLAGEVARVAGGLRALGVGRGDRVVAYMPNIPETLIAFLATASLGAIWSSAAPEFGARSVVDRFAQIEPSVLLCCDGYRHNGRDYDRRDAVGEIAAALPGLRHTVVLPYLFAEPSDVAVGAEGRETSRDGAGPGVARGPGETPPAWPGAMTWEGLAELGEGAPLSFEQVPFDHPLWVLYSSGTTGLPKAIVHGHGGILVEQLKKSRLHLDLHSGDRMFWFTTTGWMMWNFLIGCLFSEAAIVLYDGSPSHPDLGALWDLAQRTRVTCMGVSAGLLTACEKAGVEPGRDYDLSALRGIGSTGSPLAPESFAWVYGHVKRDLWLFSTSGGTDVCTAFVGGCPLLPVYEGELQCRGLGCAVEAWDARGRSVVEEVGELVLTEPLPSMPLYFWGDPDGSRYRESYFAMYPGVWRHGDWIKITRRGGAVIYGRSDATINRQGVRMGTSEIYRAAGALEEVVDALVVDVPGDAVGGAGAGAGDQDAGAGERDGRTGAGGTGGELRMLLFVVLRPGVRLDDDLVARIRRRIREDCSPRHVPDEILQIEEVPRTLSGKALEVPVKRILMGAAPAEAASVESLANPRALDFFVALAGERGR
ncbi:MAG TPA: acetoacetate--CoA ligase [Solirubrobacteraceae bacterium]|nr:acetoacetate--CoA ligase [Solirubrobacteraceae bacterium]